MDKTILKKLRGYKSQDLKFNIYSDFYFITPDLVKDKLTQCNYTCFYCKSTVKTEYLKRDPLQWTLDRIDNTMGHNKDNVLISCLGCNLKRRNRTVDKFLFTKQLIIKKIDV
jgi:hypothetical protein